MSEVKIITLENNNEYQVVDEIFYNNINYILLSNVSDNKDICIRKIEIENNDEFVSRLKKEEYDTLIKLFLEKNKELIQD